MSSFEYVSVLLSIVLALGVAHILTGIAAMIEHWRRLERYWVFLAWCGVTLGVHIGYWNALWRVHDYPSWTAPALFYWFAAVATLFVSSRLLIPSAVTWSSMREHFAAVRRPFFSAFALFWLLASTGPLFVTSTWITPYRPFSVGFTLLSFSGAVVSSERFHSALVVVWTLLYITYLSLFQKPIS